MTFFPNIESYDINVLVAFGNHTNDSFYRDEMKNMIIDKLLLCDYSMLSLLNKFINSFGILKEAYAEVIFMTMKDNDYYIDDMLVDELLKYVSLDTLINYGANSSSSYFKEKCIDEFWKVAILIEDKTELYNKSTFSKRLFRSFYRKLKGDKND